MRTPVTELRGDLDIGRVAPLARRAWIEPALAVAGFLVFCVVVLLRHSAMLEPDDFAYQASIVALSHGEILLSHAQYVALQHELSARGLGQVIQWHHMSSGYWISEKNPGYPFLAVPFYWLHVLRLAPLFYGGLGALGLYHGARAWIGRWAGVTAVGLFVASGAAMVFAWRATMPSFTDASLVAAGAGALLWTLLSREASARRRVLVGLLALLALEAATFVRYTDVIELGVAALVVLVLARRCGLTWRATWTWLASVGLFGIGTLAFDLWAYGSPTSTGYSAGEITFSLSAVWPNLRTMPVQLARTMPDWLLALGALAWIVVLAWRARRRAESAGARRDLLVAGALALGWLGLWALYLAYTWTVHAGVAHPAIPSGGVASGFGGARATLGRSGGGDLTVHVIRFYLPALGPVALLAAWALLRLGAHLRAGLVAALAVLGVVSFLAMATVTHPALGPGLGGRAGSSGVVRPGSGPVLGPGTGPPGATLG